jgi:TonB family protein
MGLLKDLFTYFAPTEQAERFPNVRFVDLKELDIVSAPHFEKFYPSFSKHAGERGAARLLVSIDASGRVVGVKVAKSSGFPRLDQAAVNLSQHFVFDSYQHNGQPCAIQTSIEVEFKG